PKINGKSPLAAQKARICLLLCKQAQVSVRKIHFAGHGGVRHLRSLTPGTRTASQDIAMVGTPVSGSRQGARHLLAPAAVRGRCQAPSEPDTWNSHSKSGYCSGGNTGVWLPTGCQTSTDAGCCARTMPGTFGA